MTSHSKFKSWMPAIMSAAVLATTYFLMFAPERDRRQALEQHILMAARSMHAEECRSAMAGEGLDADSFKSAGGYVRYEPFDGGLYMAMNATFLDDRNSPVICTVSLAPSARVEIWRPDDFD